MPTFVRLALVIAAGLPLDIATVAAGEPAEQEEAVRLLIDVQAMRQSNELAPLRDAFRPVEAEARRWSREQLGFDLTRAETVAIVWPKFDSWKWFAVAQCPAKPGVAFRVSADQSLPLLRPATTNRSPWIPHNSKQTPYPQWTHARLSWMLAAPANGWIIVGETKLVERALDASTPLLRETNRNSQLLRAGDDHLLLTAHWADAPQGLYHRFPGLFAFAQGQQLRCLIRFGAEVSLTGELDFEDADQALQAVETSRMFIAMARGILVEQDEQDNTTLQTELPNSARPAAILLQLAGRRQLGSMLESLQFHQQDATLTWSGKAPTGAANWLLAALLLAR